MRRRRLLADLAAAERTRLTLVSAPAGTGKTTLVADWARRLVLRAPTGWVTFEEDTALWPDLLSCLGRLGVAVPEPRSGASGADTISRSQLTTVAEGVAASPQRLTVVLDGYELVRPDEARDLHFLLEHSMGRLGLVLVTRVDPVLPLYRYRLDDGLTELRVADLAFTDQEAAELLHDAGVRLEPESVQAVNARVRGWAAGLRFAARALVDDAQRGRAAATAVTAGADVNEYLLGEVLDVQRPEVRRFLLETSVADVLSPALVTALCGPEARHLLTGLGHLNTFAEPVPGQPGCFRYYPFFKELLQRSWPTRSLGAGPSCTRPPRPGAVTRGCRTVPSPTWLRSRRGPRWPSCYWRPTRSACCSRRGQPPALRGARQPASLTTWRPRRPRW